LKTSGRGLSWGKGPRSEPQVKAEGKEFSLSPLVAPEDKMSIDHCP